MYNIHQQNGYVYNIVSLHNGSVVYQDTQNTDITYMISYTHEVTPIYDVEFFGTMDVLPDGRIMGISESDEHHRILNPQTLALEMEFKGHNTEMGNYLFIAIKPNKILSTDIQNNIVLWDAKIGAIESSSLPHQIIDDDKDLLHEIVQISGDQIAIIYRELPILEIWNFRKGTLTHSDY